jgi:hypothetical protein
MSVYIGTVVVWRNNWLLQDVKECELCYLYILLIRQVGFSVCNLVMVLLFTEACALVEQIQNSKVQCCLNSVHRALNLATFKNVKQLHKI